jgi:drug/metabolite transporter (DMT)-like permease
MAKAEPMEGVLLSILFLGENINRFQVLGMG